MSFNFIDYYLDYNKEAESPESFWRWSAITCLAASLRNRVYLEWHQGTVYPNMYTILFADSGIARKAAPCKFTGKLIRESCSTKFIAGRASMQGVIKDLGQSYTTENGTMLSGCAALLYSEELSAFAVADPATIPILTDLYDFHEKLSNNLISGTTHLKDVCLSLLCASNSELFKLVFNSFAINGGLLGRTFIIKEERARHRKSMFALAEAKPNKQPLLDHLKWLGTQKGMLQYSPEAKKEAEDWYLAIPEELMQDKVGFGSRIEGHAIKVAIALAASRHDESIRVEKHDMEEAIELVQGLRKTYRTLTVGLGQSTNTYVMALIVKIIIKAGKGGITRKSLIRNLFGEIDDMLQLDGILLVLCNGDLVLECRVQNDVGYKLTTKGIEKLVLGLEGD